MKVDWRENGIVLSAAAAAVALALLAAEQLAARRTQSPIVVAVEPAADVEDDGEGGAGTFLAVPLYGSLEELTPRARQELAAASPAADLLHELARQARQFRAYDLADELLARALAAEPARVESLFLRARTLSDLGDRARAMEMYAQAIALAPNHQKATYNLGVLARRAADYPRAEALLLRAAEISSGRLKSRALHQLGLVLDAAGRREEAVARLRESISLRPDAERVWVDLGYAEWRRGGIEEARTAFEKAIALDRRFADAQLAMGLFEDARGNRVRAEGFLARAVKLDPEEPAYRKALARHYLAAGDAPRARTALNWLAKQSADQADVAFAQAMLAMLDRDSARMLAEVRRADALRPGGYDDAIEQAAAALHEARRYADARALLDLLLARPQPAPEVLLAAARTASRLGQSQEAEALLLRSLRARPDNSEAWFQLGRVRSERGNVAGAIEAYRASLARNPDARNARLNLAVLYARANREAEALALYGEILAAHPRYAPALLNRARLHERAGRDQLAVTDLEAAMLAAPGDAGIRDRLARLLLRRGETDRARELLAEAIAEQPANPEMRVLMAQTELDAGQRDLALRELNRAAALAGDDRALWAQISEGYRQAGDAAAAAQAGARARASDKPGKER